MWKCTAPLLVLGFLLSGCADGALNCPAGSDPGELELSFSGLPAGVAGRVSLTGAETVAVDAPGTESLKAGLYQVKAEMAFLADALVRKAFSAQVASQVCVRAGKTQVLALSWSEVPTSHKLWAANGTGGTGALLGFSADAIRTGGAPPASVSAKGPAGKAVAFDKEGGLWSLGPTVSDALVARFRASDFAASGNVVPDRELNVPSIGCLPAVASLAFDQNGELWISSQCKGSVMRISGEDLLEASGDATPAAAVSGLSAPEGIAFDAAGNLWIAERDANQLRRVPVASVPSSAPTPDRALKLKVSADPLNPGLYSPSALAFDAGGNLWAVDFAANQLLKVSAADLAGSGDASVVPAVHVSVSVIALLEGLAFDEAGALWTPLAAGQLARFDASLLTASTDPGAPTTPSAIVDSDSIGYAAGLAFFPAAAGLPLYHSFP